MRPHARAPRARAGCPVLHIVCWKREGVWAAAGRAAWEREEESVCFLFPLLLTSGEAVCALVRACGMCRRAWEVERGGVCS